MSVILFLFFITIAAYKEDNEYDCNTDTILLNGPKELSITIIVSLVVGILIGLAVRPVIGYYRKKVTHTDPWEL